MSKRRVVLTPEFKRELKIVYTYIAEVLLVRDTAK